MHEMERMWENFLSHNWMRPSQWDLPWLGEFPMPFERRMMPKVDIVDRDRELVLRAQVPGVEKKDLHVTMTDTSVTIEGSMHQEKKEEKGNYFRRECAWGTFTRNIALPCDVDSAKAKAVLQDGMLELHLPKMTVSKRRSVAIG
ncbi:MAG TPA: Hsp20/alpha crystallin family protein [Mariprofundaceae bacterium]|nr:Hsp20/alpha crystallin family protein [Mariprofundaceae bacterium]